MGIFTLNRHSHMGGCQCHTHFTEEETKQENDAEIAQGSTANREQGRIRTQDPGCLRRRSQGKALAVGTLSWSSFSPSLLHEVNTPRAADTHTGLALLGREARPVGLARVEKFPSWSPR